MTPSSRSWDLKEATDSPATVRCAKRRRWHSPSSEIVEFMDGDDGERLRRVAGALRIDRLVHRATDEFRPAGQVSQAI
eukprot:7391937-Prymnesium_polylepis.1